MSLTTLAWLSMAAYSVHILEEFQLNWRDWARGALNLPVDWPDFYVTNGVVVALGIAQAMLAPTLPLAPLSFAALMIINALLFHIMPVIRGRRFSPGLITAVLLFLPQSVWVFWFAVEQGLADASTCIAAAIVGALIMAYPIVLLKVKSLPVFRQA